MALFILNNIVHYSQWFPGKANNVTNSLSRDFHLLDARLAALCPHMVPSQMPPTFNIFPLPPELVLTVGNWLRLQPRLEQLRQIPTKSEMASGASGKAFLQQLNSPTTPSSSVSTPTTKRASSVASPPPSRKTVPSYSPSLVQLALLYKKIPSGLPSMLWHRPTIKQTNWLLSPIHDKAGCLLHYLLGCQLRGFKNSDPNPTPQKAVSPTVIRAIASTTDTPLDQAIGQLIVGAFFFAMHSCKYSSVSGKRCTKLLELRNMRFYTNNRELSAASTFLHLADCVSITFFFQKNEQRDETITMHQTQDPTLCPIRSWWAAVCSWIHEYLDATPSTPVNTYIHPDMQKPLSITSKQVLTSIRAIITCIGKDALGYSADEVGTHSLRSATAMAIYLAVVPVFAIMLIGRWSSDAFLRYIRRQVQEFSSSVSLRMLLTAAYFTIPDFAGTEDPCTAGHHLHFAPRNQVGRVAHAVKGRTNMSLWH